MSQPAWVEALLPDLTLSRRDSDISYHRRDDDPTKATLAWASVPE